MLNVKRCVWAGLALLGLSSLLGGCPQNVGGEFVSLPTAISKATSGQLDAMSPGEIKLLVDTASQAAGTGVELPYEQASIIRDIIQQNDIKTLEQLEAAIANPQSLNITQAQIDSLTRFAESIAPSEAS